MTSYLQLELLVLDLLFVKFSSFALLGKIERIPPECPIFHMRSYFLRHSDQRWTLGLFPPAEHLTEPPVKFLCSVFSLFGHCSFLRADRVLF